MNVDKDRLIEARIESGYTTEEIKAKTGVARNTLRRIEKGINEPTASTLKKLCDLYRKTPAYFLKRGTS